MNLKQIVDSTNFEHSHKVAQISALLAMKAGMSPTEAAIIEQAALYHDVGKVFIPPEVLNKPGKLTTEEYALVKTHTMIGYKQLLEAVQILTVASIVAREHHEREDGSGYMCLGSQEIHPYAKLISVADVYDALISRRAYKSPWSEADVREYFQSQSGKQFDPYFVSLLLSLLDDIRAIYQKQG